MEKTMNRIELNERARRQKKIKAVVIMVLLTAVTITCLSVLWLWERRLFTVILYAFGAVGFIRVMTVLITWIDELTIEQDKPTVEDWAEYRGK